ncbi:ATP-dependent DNA helicase RecG [bacterium]|nr:ATP-dependent DNA helicase RecG [bacterium]
MTLPACSTRMRVFLNPPQEGIIATETTILSPVRFLKGVGPKSAGILAKAGVETIEDLFYYVPRAYTDWSEVSEVDRLRVGDRVTVIVKVLSSDLNRWRGGRSVFMAALEDDSGAIFARWYNQPYLKTTLTKGSKIVLSGEVRFDRHARRKEFINPAFELMGEKDVAELVHAGRIVPEYSQTGGISGKRIRRIMKTALDRHLDEVTELLPAWVVKRRSLPARRDAFRDVHFATSLEIAGRARMRLAYEEFFLFQVVVAARRRRLKTREAGVKGYTWDKHEHERFLGSLPFELTAAQNRVISEIRTDIEEPGTMNRLLQGDVGSGKTVVAAAAMHHAVAAGFQVAIMAPTEILAEQHYASISSLLGALGDRIVLLRGGMKAKERAEALESISTGAAAVVVGTHALIQKGVEFHRLGLVIVDEQHRFGVTQRAALRKKGRSPDVLVMTATPIPRTLSLTVYGDLDVSVIDELPPGRTPITTAVRDESGRGRVYDFLRSQVEDGRQVFIVYPLVEESDKIELAAATKMHEELNRKIFPDIAIGLVHGRMKAEDKASVMNAFSSGEISILVSTTVVEVGVDIPNATVMVIEHCERFGLAQLHQLRGRVGRGEHRSYCILMVGRGASDEARERIQVLADTSDGFVIAERDLKLRGPGEFMGVRQHGIPKFAVADLVMDMRLLVNAREDAFELLEQDGALAEPESRAVVDAIKRRFKGRGALIDVG